MSINSFTGTQPCPSIYVPSMVAFDYSGGAEWLAQGLYGPQR